MEVSASAAADDEPAIDLEASPVQGQTASAVLDLEGNIVRGGEEQLPDDAPILFQMLVEVGSLHLKTFRRLTVSLHDRRYVVSRDERHVYIVQTKVAG